MKSSFGSGDIRKIKNQPPHFLPWFSSSASVYIVVLAWGGALILTIQLKINFVLLLNPRTTMPFFPVRTTGVGWYPPRYKKNVID